MNSRTYCKYAGCTSTRILKRIHAHGRLHVKIASQIHLRIDLSQRVGLHQLDCGPELDTASQAGREIRVEMLEIIVRTVRRERVEQSENA